MFIAMAALLLQIQATQPTKVIIAVRSDATKAEPSVSASTAGSGSSSAILHVDSLLANEPSTETPFNGSLSNASRGSTNKTNTQSLSTIRIPENSAPPVKPGPAEALSIRRSWLLLSMVQHGAATFDAYSTRQAIAKGGVERDPLMRPFAHSPAIYAAVQVGPGILDFVSRRMQRSQSNWIRRVWWLPQSMATAGFVFSGAHNLNVTRQP